MKNSGKDFDKIYSSSTSGKSLALDSSVVEDKFLDGQNADAEKKIKEIALNESSYEFIERIGVLRKEINQDFKSYLSSSEFKRKLKKDIDNAIDKYTKEEKFASLVDKIIKETKDKLEEKIDSSRIKTIESLGIFVTLFTFISIDFQVFRMYRDPWAISGLTLILLGSIAYLMLIFDYFVSYSEKKRWGRIIFSALSALCIITGILMFKNSNLEILDDSKEEIRKEVKIELGQDFKEDMNAVVNDKLNSSEDIKKAQNDIKALQENDTCMKYKKNWEYEQCFK